MRRVNTDVNGDRKPRWLSPRAISSSSSAGNSRRICSSALGGTMRSLAGAPTLLMGSSILESRWPFVATMRMYSGRSSQSTPLRIGRLSSVLTANAVCEMSFCRSPERTRQLSWKRTVGNDGNSSRGSPSSLKRERPHSSDTRCSPDAAILTGAGGSSRAISASLRAGIVIAPGASMSAVTSVLTAISRSVPDSRMPRSVVSTRMFASTGSVVFAGMLAATAVRPSCSFSREIVNRIPAPQCGQVVSPYQYRDI